MNDKKILLFQKLVPSYRVAVFRELYTQYGVITCHSKERKGGTWKSFAHKMDYPNELVSRFYLGKSETAVLQSILPVLFKYRPKIVITEFSLGYLTYWLLLILKPFFRYKLVLWTHGVRNNELSKPFNTRIRKFFLNILKRADAVILYSEQRKSIIAGLLKRNDHIFLASNTIDTYTYKKILDNLMIIGKEKIKEELAFKSKFNLIYTGRLLHDKRIDLMLDSFMLLIDKIDVDLHIIGDGPEVYRIKDHIKLTDRIHWYGAIYDEEKVAKFLFASDLYLMPGYVGLGIVHAFSFGLSVVSCLSTEDGPFHSPEVEYLQEGVNGIWCKTDALNIADRICYALSDSKILNEMSKNALNTAYYERTLQRMILGFGDAINYLSKEEKLKK